MMLSEKSLLIDENAKRLADFLLSDETSFEMFLHSKIPFRLFSGERVHYQKERVRVGKNHIDIVKINGEVSHFLWRTTASKIQKAVLSGLLPFESLTSKTLSALGQYTRQSYARMYDNGIISNLYREKNILLSYTQARIIALQALELKINNYDHSLSVEENLQTLNTLLINYEKQISKLFFIQYDERLDELTRYDANIKNSYYSHLENDIANIKRLQAQIKAARRHGDKQQAMRFFRSANSRSIANFIKLQSIAAIRQLQQSNQNLCYSRFNKAFLRGDLNSFCEDALKIISDHQNDLHNTTLKAHQGHFDEHTDKPLVVDFSFLGTNNQANRQALMTICQIEKADKLVTYPHIGHKLKGKCFKSKTTFESPLKTTSKTKWSNNESLFYAFFRITAWGWNVFIGIFIGLTIDLIGGIISGLLGRKIPSFAKEFQIEIENKIINKTRFGELIDKIKKPTYSLGTIIGFKLSNFVKNITWDLFKGASTSLQQYKVELWENLQADYTIGHQQIGSNQEIIKRYKANIAELKKTEKQYHRSLIEKAPKDYKPEHQLSPSAEYALPPYHLANHDYLDLLNQAVRGLRFVAESITHPIHAKHPATGLVFTSAYFLGAFAIINPNLISFMPKQYISFCNTLAKAMSKGKFSNAVSCAMTQAQVSSLTFEAFLHGHRSWLVTGGKLFEKNPSNILVYITLAVGLGALIAFELNIPGLSEVIREDLGNIPIPALGFAGAKIGILLIDLLEEKDSETHRHKTSVIEKQLEQVLKALSESTTTHIPHKHIKKTLKRTVSTLLSDSFLNEFRKQYQLTDTSVRKEQKLALKRLQFMFMLERDQAYLFELSHHTKRDLLELAKSLFPNDQETLSSIKKLLYPPPPQSIFIVTVVTALNYIPLLFRNMTMPITGSIQPYLDLKDKLLKDLSRVVNALTQAVIGLSIFIRSITRGIFDIIGNEILARTTSFVLGNSHPISSSTYTISERLDCQFETVREQFNEPNLYLKQQVTTPESYRLFRNASQSFIFSNSDLLVSQAKQAPTAGHKPSI